MTQEMKTGKEISYEEFYKTVEEQDKAGGGILIYQVRMTKQAEGSGFLYTLKTMQIFRYGGQEIFTELEPKHFRNEGYISAMSELRRILTNLASEMQGHYENIETLADVPLDIFLT